MQKVKVISGKYPGIYECPNYGESYSDRYFMVSLDPHLRGWVFNAGNAQEALDAAADYCEEKGWEGYFLDDETVQEYEPFGEVTYAGNHGRPLMSSDIYIQQVKINEVQE